MIKTSCEKYTEGFDTLDSHLSLVEVEMLLVGSTLTTMFKVHLNEFCVQNLNNIKNQNLFPETSASSWSAEKEKGGKCGQGDPKQSARSTSKDNFGARGHVESNFYNEGDHSEDSFDHSGSDK